MSNALVGLNQIPGVIGSAIFNAQDECVVHMMPAPFDPELLGKVMAEIRNTLNILAYLDENATWSAIVIRYEGGYLVVRSVQGLTIVVLAQPTLNPAMLSVGFNVAALKLEKEGVPPPLHVPLPLPLPPPPAASAPPPMAHAMPPPMAHATPPPPPPMMASPRTTLTGMPAMAPAPPPPPPVSSSQNLSISQSGRIPMAVTPISHSSQHVAQSGTGQIYRESVDSGITQRAPDGVGPHVMDGLLKALARHIGPFAKLILKEELHKLGATAATLGFGQYEDFVGMLAGRLQDPAKRREFIEEAERLPHKR
jgi:predicted regulator of Ras-like GTPase activity (Roadblock/LC7/MglB family)